MFYLPEVLTNENSIDFGTTQLGEKLGIVVPFLVTAKTYAWHGEIFVI